MSKNRIKHTRAILDNRIKGWEETQKSLRGNKRLPGYKKPGAKPARFGRK
jgi:hypothetical protein